MIMRSGAPAVDSFVASNVSANNTAEVAKTLGCLSADSAQVLACLRRVPYDQLLNATLSYDDTITSFGFDVFIPSVDHDFIPAAPSELVRSGRFCRNVPLITGWNLNDESLFVDSTLTNSTVIPYFGQTYPGITNSTLTQMLSLYPGSEYTETPGSNATAAYYRVSRIERDFGFVCPSLAFALTAAHYSNASNFVYQLEQTPLAQFLAESGVTQYGVLHFSEIFYVFNEIQAVLHIGATQSDVALGSRMSGSWTQFANTGVPVNDELRALNASLANWPDAFNAANGGGGAPDLSDLSQLEVFAIGGIQEGLVSVNDATTHQGLDRPLERCAFFSTPDFYRQLAT